LGDEDENHLARATEKGYVLCTHDSDYIDMAVAGKEHAGIVFGQTEKHYIGEWVRWLELMDAIYSPEDMKNHVEYVK
jgi:hypothetical protein